MVKVVLNEEKFRYDIYQIINLYHSFQDIEFTKDEGDYYINIDSYNIEIKGKELEKTYPISKDVRTDIKKSVFSYFKDIMDKPLPWGTLVGIRPSKIALSMIKEGKSEEEIIEYFNEKYLVSREKAKLCIDVARYEEEFVNTSKDSISVYIGMPFCPTRCVYCSFTANPIGGNKSLVKPYLDALIYEIKEIASYIKEKNLTLQCVYFGGGTPTSVNDEDFRYLMEEIYNNLIEGKNVEEFTVECGRPDSISIDKLKTMRDFKVHRISINPQTMNDSTLKSIGRNHSVDLVKEVYNEARDMGFDNINMDLIVGLPGEDLSHIKKSYEEILKLKPDSLTIHGMSVKRASRLYEDICHNKTLKIPHQRELNSMYDLTKDLGKDLGMNPYYMYRQKNMVGNMENVGYAVKGKEGIYNIQIIEERQTIIALGADGVSKVVFLDENRIERFANVKDVREYIKRVSEMVDKKKALLSTLYTS
ncbi:coproporphyrinogen III oxidase [Clostridium hydrogeniformans]|uniref:coproporphyrinogen III oxidase n=1 Tax=Clostridium hydrogeniformans TaxID=349933 RepID=UPI00054D02D5|nr:coproporphyrinogen III oxidase [Clostridium hydrogeniformans]